MSLTTNTASSRGPSFPSWKRGLDLFVIILGAPILLPLALFVGILNCVFLGRPVFFTQERPGLGGKTFRMVKFRTMLHAVDEHGEPLPDAQRLTRYGRLLRSTSLDELPELINVLKGEMSLVGPRPLLVEYLERYSPKQARRHEVPPGVTGWAQINGRNTLEWEQVFEHDVWYVDNMSLLLDLKIMVLTVLKVLKREGISSAGSATREKFMGNK